MDLDIWMIDSTSIRATRAASGGVNKGSAKTPQTMRRGGAEASLTTKVQMVCDRHGWPLAFTLSPGQVSDTRHFTTKENIHLPGATGRPRKRCRFSVAEKVYDSDPLRRYCDRYRMKPIIARRKIKRKPRPCALRGFNKPRYQ
jgi:hypothetical protein